MWFWSGLPSIISFSYCQCCGHSVTVSVMNLSVVCRTCMKMDNNKLLLYILLLLLVQTGNMLQIGCEEPLTEDDGQCYEDNKTG